MKNIKLLLVALLFSLIPAQLIRLQLTQTGAITTSDILVATIDCFFICYILLNKIALKLPKIIILAFLFLLSAFTSTIIALNVFSLTQVLTASFFMIRLAAYILISVVTINVINKTEVEKWIKILVGVGIIFATAGVMQFLFFPNLTPLQSFGWDPHVFRLVSTTLDPNYTGMILTFFATLTTSIYLFKKHKIYIFLTAFFIGAILLTFSRSSYLAILISMLAIGSIKSPKTFLIAISFFILSFIFVPQVRNRITGAFLIDETANARIISWQKALIIFKDNPLFGVGYDTYRFAQTKYGFIQNSPDSGGHSGAGVDSSFLFVLATTGVVGFSFFLVMVISLMKVSMKNAKNNYLSLAFFASFTALLFHTQFVNSFMFPQIMLIFWFLVGLLYVSNY